MVSQQMTNKPVVRKGNETSQKKQEQKSPIRRLLLLLFKIFYCNFLRKYHQTLHTINIL